MSIERILRSPAGKCGGVFEPYSSNTLLSRAPPLPFTPPNTPHVSPIVCLFHTHTHTHIHTLTHSLTLSLSLSHTHTHTHTLSLSLSLALSHTHSFSLTRTHSVSLTLSHILSQTHASSPTSCSNRVPTWDVTYDASRVAQLFHDVCETTV